MRLNNLLSDRKISLIQSTQALRVIFGSVYDVLRLFEIVFKAPYPRDVKFFYIKKSMIKYNFLREQQQSKHNKFMAFFFHSHLKFYSKVLQRGF